VQSVAALPGGFAQKRINQPTATFAMLTPSSRSNIRIGADS
jgi:hypothetical protein